MLHACICWEFWRYFLSENKNPSLLLGLVPYLLHGLRRHSRYSRWVWLTCWGYCSVCCLCIFSKRWKQPIGFSRMANSDPSQQLWLSSVCHPLYPCVCARVRVGVWECGRRGSDGLKVTYDSWSSQGLMATIGEVLYKRCGWIIRTSFSHHRVYLLTWYSLDILYTRGQHFWVKGTFGGLSWRWFSREECTTGGVTVYTGEERDMRHCRDSRQGPEENETWKMSLGYCDILHLDRVWKGSNTNREVKATAMNMSRLHEKTCYTPFIPFTSEVLI